MSGQGALTFDRGEAVTLSTGQTLEFPISTNSTITAVILSANRDFAAELLPDGLAPIRAGRGRAAVWLMSAQHRNVGGGSLDDYNEFAVMISATAGEMKGTPYISPLFRTETYVWYMPVTHEPARAFGDELWGYPKEVADIEIDEHDGTHRTTVTVDGDHFITLEVEHPPTFSQEDTLTTYTVKDDTLLRVDTDTVGEMGIWPYTTKFSYTLGDHPRASELDQLDLGSRAFGRFHGKGELVFPSGDPIDNR